MHVGSLPELQFQTSLSAAVIQSSYGLTAIAQVRVNLDGLLAAFA